MSGLLVRLYGPVYGLSEERFTALVNKNTCVHVPRSLYTKGFTLCLCATGIGRTFFIYSLNSSKKYLGLGSKSLINTNSPGICNELPNTKSAELASVSSLMRVRNPNNTVDSTHVHSVSLD